MALHENNKIVVFGKNMVVGTASTNPSIGSARTDISWKSSTNRTNGSIEGIAGSIDYNTALRQASFMATILAEAIMNRFSEASVEFGTGDKTGDELENLIANWGSKFSPANFLQLNEVKTKHIDANAITTEKITNNSVTADKLAENIVKNSMTVGTSKAITFTTELPSSAGKTGELIIYLGKAPSSDTKLLSNVLYLFYL